MDRKNKFNDPFNGLLSAMVDGTCVDYHAVF